jgi:nitrite reductase/ring-hydroxylating ferredoxin subunit
MVLAAPTGHFSVASPRRAWYPACRSSELGKAPLAFTLMDEPLVAFRDRLGSAHVLIDRCPHRNAPLSLGEVHADGTLECGYHGWRFDGSGRCRSVPGLYDGDVASSPVRDVTSHATRELDGFVWVWGEAGAEPTGEPFRLPDLTRAAADGVAAQTSAGVGEVVLPFDLDCTVHAALENALDVPHTAFLHRGIFRGSGNQREITAVRRAVPGGVEVEYLGEPVGMGPVRAKQGAELTFDHWDRFYLPSIAQIEYRVPGWLHIVNTIPHLPLSPLRTRCWFVVRYWSRIPGWLGRPIVWLRGQQIARQDVGMLAQQTANAERFGGERYTSTDLDLLGPAIWRMLRQAVKAEGIDGHPFDEGRVPPEPTDPVERQVTFRA